MKQSEFDKAIKIIQKSIDGFKDCNGKIEILQVFNTAVSQIDLLMDMLSINDKIGLKRLSKLRNLHKDAVAGYDLFKEVYQNLEESELKDIERALEKLKNDKKD